MLKGLLCIDRIIFMNVKEVLQYVDGLVLQKTGKHLDDVQKAVVEGTWQKQTYDDIAKKCHVTKNHVGDVGYHLWQLLSEVIGEDIKKINFRSTIERLKLSSSQFINIQSSHDFRFCLYPNNSTNNNQETYEKCSHQDLTISPQIIKCDGREKELKTLFDWILGQKYRLISVLGLSGIGKSYLVKRFVDLNLDKFEIIMWRSLKYPDCLDILISELLNTCQQETKETLQANLKLLFETFIRKKCLIILDDVQNLFIRDELAGQYKAEYQDYQNFFTKIIETEHQSNIILISQEQCTEMECLDEELYPVKYLELSGLFEVDLLKNWGLKDEDSWLDLMNLYEGNLFYLKSIAMLINNNYDGQVADFLAENSLFITNKMQSHFREIFNYLSPTEQEIVLQLGKVEKPITREDLRQSLNLSSVDFNNGLQSLQKRYLVKKIKEDKVRFKLSNVFREYVINFCKK